MANNPGDWVRDSRQFLTEVQAEFKKVTWPAQQEYTYGTIGVVVVVTIVTIVLALTDFTLGRLVQSILP